MTATTECVLKDGGGGLKDDDVRQPFSLHTHTRTKTQEASSRWSLFSRSMERAAALGGNGRCFKEDRYYVFVSYFKL